MHSGVFFRWFRSCICHCDLSEMGDEGWFVYVCLVASKAKVGPMFETSTSRLEMNGATLLSRAVLRVVVAMMDDPPGQVFCI